MFKKMFVLLFSIAVSSMAIAENATQTDWSGGPGVSGPVIDWGNTFDMESGINWSSSAGELILAYSSPMEHPISGGYVRANCAHPVDIDGDGDMDVLGAAGRYSPPYFFSGRIDWWENTDGSGTNWTRYTVDDNFVSAPSVCGADVDGDGDMDVLGAARGDVNDIAWWENIDGSGHTWAEHTVPGSIRDCSSIWAADMDGDEYIDIISTDASYNNVIWLENVDGSGTDWIEHFVDSFNNATDVYVTDMDGDEDMDVLAASYNSDNIYWWENADGSGTDWIEHIVDSSFNGARSVYAADVDGDGDTDVLGAAALGWAVTWWENIDGDGNTWMEHSIADNFNWAFSVHASDLEGDGDVDILGASFFGDDITWWENVGGHGNTWIEHTVDGNFDGARDVNTADFDGDGDIDVLGAAQEDADISWWDILCCVEGGELVSSILDTESEAQWDSLDWTSDEPSGTSIYFQVRSSTDPEYMGDWSDDITMPGNLEDYLGYGDRFVQYKVMLGSTDQNLTPVLEDVAVSWDEVVGVDDDHEYAELSTFQLSRNYPNPFNASTVIKYSLPQASHVTLEIYDLLGRRVETLAQGEQPAGYHQMLWDASDHSSGMYFYRIQAGDYAETRKMVLLK
jgi:hypothetical protein